MEYNVFSTDISELNKEQKDFLILHNSIIANGKAAEMYAIETARGLKEMRDSGKYKAAGFETFKDYTETACGIKVRQAYNYISFVENLSESFLQSNAQLGVTKLTLLASMSSESREGFIEEHGDELEKLTMRELDKLRKEYESRIQQLHMEYDGKLSEKNEEIAELCGKIDLFGEPKIEYIESENSELKTQLEAVVSEKAEVERELERLKNAPAKVDEKSEAELAKAKDELRKIKEAKAAAEKRAKDEEEKREKEIAAITEKERAAAKAIEKELEQQLARLEAESKKAKIAADPVMSDFKARFTLWQEMGNTLLTLLGSMESDNAEKCVKALNAVLESLHKALPTELKASAPAKIEVKQ